MSLILEALKKLERDRQTHERGFLVLGQPSWSAAGGRGWTGRAPLLAAAALAGAAIAAVLLWPGHSREAARSEAAPSTTLAAGPAAPLASVPQAASSAPNLAAASPPAQRPLVVWRPVYGSPRARTAVQPPVPAAVAPTPEPAPAVEVLQLQAISERDGAPVAVVSGQMVRVGDRIGDGTVVRIGAAEIEIETDGQRRVLKF